jgi:hypothetical protein
MADSLFDQTQPQPHFRCGQAERSEGGGLAVLMPCATGRARSAVMMDEPAEPNEGGGVD